MSHVRIASSSSKPHTRSLSVAETKHKKHSAAGSRTDVTDFPPSSIALHAGAKSPATGVHGRLNVPLSAIERNCTRGEIKKSSEVYGGPRHESFYSSLE
jgi:hypothetical protein